MKQILLPLAGAALFIILVGLLTKSVEDGKSFNLNIYEPAAEAKKEVKIRDATIIVEVIDTEESRSKGLSGRQTLPENEGMLFVFEDKAVFPSFWMKDTLIPLDIIWIREGAIVKIDKNVQPEQGKAQDELTLYKPSRLIDYVLEVNAGISEKYGFETGDTVSLPSGY